MMLFLKDNEYDNEKLEIIKKYNSNIEVFNTTYQIKNLNLFDLSKIFNFFRNRKPKILEIY